ncbi:MAG: DUF3991 and TOPRIM domain-containing protein [Oscillospiraceae bacterium]|nr:DUF3991 and TOPRIM domain-containing protein [Oscillospiraceae bacterium]
MTPYIHFTEEQKERAASVDLEVFLRHRGEKLIPSGRELRLHSDHSITVRGNEWFDHAIHQGGHAVSFVQKHYGLNYPDAMRLLLSDEMGLSYPSAKERQEPEPKPFALPQAHSDMRRVFGYLIKHRRIDPGVVSFFAKEKLIYEDAKYHNAVFVGLDADGVPRHAHKRSTNRTGKAFRLNIEGSDPKHCFHHSGDDGNLFVFEAPIDMLSYISLFPHDWKHNSYVACCGTSAQPVLEQLNQHPHLQTVYLCHDNDDAGHSAGMRLTELLSEHPVTVHRLVPQHKDWNDDLVAQSEEETIEMEVNQCAQTLG